MFNQIKLGILGYPGRERKARILGRPEKIGEINCQCARGKIYHVLICTPDRRILPYLWLVVRVKRDTTSYVISKVTAALWL